MVQIHELSKEINLHFISTGMDAKQKHVFHLGEAGITEVVQPGTSLFLLVVLVSQYQAQVLSKELESY